MARGYLPVREQYAEANRVERERRRTFRSEGDPEVRDDEVFFAPNKTLTCQLCHQPAFEVRPFGPNHESICEDCADKAPELAEQRWRELGGI